MEKVISLEDVHFDFDKATLTKEAQAILRTDMQTLKDDPGMKVRIEGQTCSHGSDDYNLRLGGRRADSVKEFLTNEGLNADRRSTISYGKTRPLCVDEPIPKNKNDQCMKENRRVHFEVSCIKHIGLQGQAVRRLTRSTPLCCDGQVFEASLYLPSPLWGVN
jgi:outer membrane protein OmpA-like peptidoglycan-associated protein